MKATHTAETVQGGLVNGVLHQTKHATFIIVYHDGVPTAMQWEVKPETVKVIEDE